MNLQSLKKGLCENVNLQKVFDKYAKLNKQIKRGSVNEKVVFFYLCLKDKTVVSKKLLKKYFNEYFLFSSKANQHVRNELFPEINKTQ